MIHADENVVHALYINFSIFVTILSWILYCLEDSTSGNPKILPTLVCRRSDNRLEVSCVNLHIFIYRNTIVYNLVFFAGKVFFVVKRHKVIY